MEVAKHLEAGKQVTRLELTLNGRVSFVVGEDLVVRKLRLLDIAIDDLQSEERDDIRAELNARFALIAAEVRLIFRVMERASIGSASCRERVCLYVSISLVAVYSKKQKTYE